MTLELTTRSPPRTASASSPLRPDGDAQGARRVRVLLRPVADGMLWGATLRSPHAQRADHAASTSRPRWPCPACYAVLTHEDVPGVNAYGLEHRDQPVLAHDQVRYQGEAVALVAADHPETARRAAALVEVDYEELPPVTDPRAARSEVTARRCTRAATPCGTCRIRHGDPRAPRPTSSSPASTRSACRTRRSSGPSRASPCPAEDGGVDLYVATQWLHVDRGQVAACLGLPPRSRSGSRWPASAARSARREDLSMQVHACMLALRTGRPVKMVYTREESFFGHVHRHPAWMRYEHGATADGRLVYVAREIVLDGGAYASSTPAVVANAASLGVGPYEVPNVADRRLRRLHQQPAVRRDARLRRGAGLLRLRVADGPARRRARARPGRDPGAQRGAPGRRLPPGRCVDGPAPVRRAARAGCAPCRCRRAAHLGDLRDRCPAASPTPPTARACAAASATASASRTSASPRASTTTPPPA